MSNLKIELFDLKKLEVVSTYIQKFPNKTFSLAKGSNQSSRCFIGKLISNFLKDAFPDCKVYDLQTRSKLILHICGCPIKEYEPGMADYFICNGTSRKWVEVKINNDGLKRDQFLWLSKQKATDEIFVLFVSEVLDDGRKKSYY